MRESSCCVREYRPVLALLSAVAKVANSGMLWLAASHKASVVARQ